MSRSVEKILKIPGWNCAGTLAESGPCGGCRDCILNQYYYGIHVYLEWRKHRDPVRKIIEGFIEAGEPFNVYDVGYAYAKVTGRFGDLRGPRIAEKILAKLTRDGIVEVSYDWDEPRYLGI